MKSIMLFGIVCLAVLVNADRVDHLSGVREKCKAECELPEDAPLDTDSVTYNKDPKVCYCYNECFFKTTKIYKDSATGEVDEEHTLTLLDEDIREKCRPLVKKCIAAGTGISNRGEQSCTMMTCVLNENPSVFDLLGVFQRPKPSNVPKKD